jgi:outer membrane protein assembly factor BamB
LDNSVTTDLRFSPSGPRRWWAALLVIAVACDDPFRGGGPDPRSSKPGDVIWGVAGTGIGVVNMDAERVFFPGWEHELTAVEKKTGRLLWRATTPVTTLQRSYGTAVAGSIVAYSDGLIFAFDRATGALRWTFGSDTILPGYAIPVTRGDTIFAGALRGDVYALDAATGHELWHRPSVPAYPAAAFDPVLDDDQLFVGYGERGGVTIRGGLAALDAATGEVQWYHDFAQYAPATESARCQGRVVVSSTTVFAWFESGDIVALDRQSGALKWRRPGNAPGYRNSALARGVLFVTANDGHLEGLDPETGDTLWTVPFLGLGTVIYPLVTDGSIVYFTASGGHLAAIDPESGEAKWIVGPQTPPRLELNGTPAIGDSVLYVGGYNVLYAIRK